MQISFFEGSEPLKINKPVRLIELFAGIGAQSKALERLGIPFERHRICEWDKYAIMSYNAIHGTEFATSDITKIHAPDLGIVDTDRFTYLLTYSFPCTDLSLAGKQAGMEKGSGTRSGLLWEVERLLKEMVELPQILLMENVPQVKTANGFSDWCMFLESLGYTNKCEVLNAKNYGVPQNRERAFMVSWLGDYYFDFPEPIPLTECMMDRLEDIVDERYYLSDETVEYFMKHSAEMEEKGNGFRFTPVERERELQRQSQREQGQEWTITSSRKYGALISGQGKKVERLTGIAGTIMARDYKGFGNQASNGVIEINE